MFEMVPWRRYRTPLARPRKDLFHWFLEDFDLPGFGPGEREWTPPFDVSETEGEVIVKAEIPGMKVEDIDITLTDGLLTIKGERKMEKEDKQENYHRIERHFGTFSRSLNLGLKVKADGIDADYKDGVLTITLPKTEQAKAKTPPTVDLGYSRKEAVIARGFANLHQIFVERALNAEIWDVEGNRYIDFAGGVAVIGTGHSHPDITAAVKEQLDRFSHTCACNTTSTPTALSEGGVR